MTFLPRAPFIRAVLNFLNAFGAGRRHARRVSRCAENKQQEKKYWEDSFHSWLILFCGCRVEDKSGRIRRVKRITGKLLGTISERPVGIAAVSQVRITRADNFGLLPQSASRSVGILRLTCRCQSGRTFAQRMLNIPVSTHSRVCSAAHATMGCRRLKTVLLLWLEARDVGSPVRERCPV